ILRMQRDEFLPLRVIRQELASGRGGGDARLSDDGAEPRGDAPRQTSVSVSSRGTFHREADVLHEARADEKLLKELIDFGLISGKAGKEGTLFDDAEREIVLVAAQLSRYGIGARHLRTFRSSADREAGLLQQ